MAGMNRMVRDEWHLLTGSYAVDALSGQEREGFERHLHHCGSCDAEVRGLRETAARLALARSLRPPPGLQDRVLAAWPRSSAERAAYHGDPERTSTPFSRTSDVSRPGLRRAPAR